MPGWALLHSDYTYGDEALSCKFANDGHYAVGSKDGFVRYYDSSYNLVWFNQRNSNSEIRSLDFSPNSSYLLVTWSTNNRKVAIFDVSSNTSEINLTVSNALAFYSVDWSPDGSLFAYGNKEKEVYINNGAEVSLFDSNLHIFGEPANDVESVNFSYDSNWLVAGTKNNDVFFYKRDCTPTPLRNQQYCPA